MRFKIQNSLKIKMMWLQKTNNVRALIKTRSLKAVDRLQVQNKLKYSATCRQVKNKIVSLNKS